MAFVILSSVADSNEDENDLMFPLKAMMLKESSWLSSEREFINAAFEFSRGSSCMLPLMSIRNTTSFLKGYDDITLITQMKKTVKNLKLEIVIEEWIMILEVPKYFTNLWNFVTPREKIEAKHISLIIIMKRWSMQ